MATFNDPLMLYFLSPDQAVELGAEPGENGLVRLMPKSKSRWGGIYAEFIQHTKNDMLPVMGIFFMHSKRRCSFMNEVGGLKDDVETYILHFDPEGEQAMCDYKGDVFADVLMIFTLTKAQREESNIDTWFCLAPECIPRWKDIFLKIRDRNPNNPLEFIACLLEYSTKNMIYHMRMGDLNDPIKVYMFTYDDDKLAALCAAADAPVV